MRQSGINVLLSSHPIILEYLLHDQRAVSHRIQPAHLKIGLGKALVSRECHGEYKRTVWVSLVIFCSNKNSLVGQLLDMIPSLRRNLLQMNFNDSRESTGALAFCSKLMNRSLYFSGTVS